MISDFKKSRIIKLAQTGNESFSAYRANRNNYEGLASPVMGFDDFRLTSDVFGPHEHRHMSALTYLFEDSDPYHNVDSMGNDRTITPGSLLWTWGGSGVAHHEYPEIENAKIHGLQLFLGIPSETRTLPPKSVFIPVEQMPVREADGVHVKLVMGVTTGLVSSVRTPEDITLIDLRITVDKTFQHILPAGWNGMIYILSGIVELTLPDGNVALDTHETIALSASVEDANIHFNAKADSHLLFISGLPVV